MTDSETAQTAPSRRSGFRRAVPWALAVPVGLLFLAALFLIDRDLRAPDWLRARIEARADVVLAGGRVEFGDVVLRLDRDLHPGLRLTDTVLRDAENRVIARLGEVRIGVSPRGLLFERAALVQNIALSGLTVEVLRDETGAVQVAFDRRDGGTPIFADGVGGVVDQVDGLRNRPAFAAMEQVRIDNLRVMYRDARANSDWTGRGDIALTTGRDRTTGAASFDVATSGDPIDLDVTFDSPRDSLAATARITLTDLPAQVLASQSIALAPLRALDAPVSARLDLVRTPEGPLAPLDMTLDIGPGRFAVKGRDETLTSARIAATYDLAQQRADISEVSINADSVKAHGQGRIILDGPETGRPDAAVVQLVLGPSILNLDPLYDDPVTLDRGDLDLRLTLDPFRVHIGQAMLDLGDDTVSAAGTVTSAPDGLSVAVDLSSRRMAAQTAVALWPRRLRPGTRDWVARNVAGGTLDDLTLALRIVPDAEPQTALTFAFTDAEVSYLRGGPPVTRASGFASLGGGRFDVAVDRGRVIASQGGALNVAGTQVAIADLSQKPAPLTVDLRARGTVTAALAVLNAPPLGLMDRTGLPVTLADGRAEIAADISIPLQQQVRGPDVTYEATATVTRLRSDTLVPGRVLSARQVTVTADPGQVQVQGAATLDGVPMTGRFRQALGPGAEPARAQVDATLTPEALQTFGIALPPDTLSGSGRASIDLRLPRGSAPTLTARSDLNGLRLSVPAIGWTKPASVAGDLTVSASLGSAPQIESLSLNAPGLRADGAIQLAEGRLQQARFTRVRVGDWFDGAVTLAGRGPGAAPAVQIGGGVLDLSRAKLGEGGSGGGSGQGGPLDITLDRLDIAGNLFLSNFSGQFNTTGGLRGRFAADFNGAAPVQGAVEPRDGRAAVHIGSADAGAVLRAGEFLRGASGGQLDLTLLPAASAGSYDGALAIRSLRVRDAPGIAALLDAISVVGLLQQLDGQGLAFDTVDAQFRLTPDAITVTQSSAVGPGLGISLDGIYRLASKQVEFQGVISPFYVLNGIGSFLTRRGEGLIGFNFNLDGLAASPRVSVNPLSLLTPGMFREIFRKPPPQVSP